MGNQFRLTSTVYDRGEDEQKILVEKRILGYDINYRKYLNKYNRKLDEFAVFIDLDKDTHSEANMCECIRYCRENKELYAFYG